MAMGVLKAEEAFLHISVGMAQIVCVELSDLYYSIFGHRFFIYVMVEELFLLNQENSYVMFS